MCLLVFSRIEIIPPARMRRKALCVHAVSSVFRPSLDSHRRTEQSGACICRLWLDYDRHLGMTDCRLQPSSRSVKRIAASIVNTISPALYSRIDPSSPCLDWNCRIIYSCTLFRSRYHFRESAQMSSNDAFTNLTECLDLHDWEYFSL